MTTSDGRRGMSPGATGGSPERLGVYVWVWLPGAVRPVVAGFLEPMGQVLAFTYGRSYLARDDAIPLYLPELPLTRGRIRPDADLDVAGCIRDAAPDAWGQRVILARHTRASTAGRDTAELPLLTYLIESGSDRVGALDFQNSPTEYVPRDASATLEQLQAAAAMIEAGEPLPGSLEQPLLHGTSIGGARPKVTITDDDGTGMIAKLSSATDPYPVVRAEGAAMELAGRVGLDVASTRVLRSGGRDVLLVRRFDRTAVPGERRLLLSALTMLGLSEMTGRYATYPELADLVRARFIDPRQTLRELFSRIVFNICIGNTDDHARNHAAFWDGRELTLTPAYDLCPQLRAGEEAAQAMAIGRDGQRRSQLRVCVDAASEYLLTRAEAADIIDHQVTTITAEWDDAADAARLTRVERQRMWGRQILNPFIHYDT